MVKRVIYPNYECVSLNTTITRDWMGVIAICKNAELWTLSDVMAVPSLPPVPSVAPSNSPTAFLNTLPTNYPTFNPSIALAALPSATPTTTPTMKPTATTEVATTLPSANPSPVEVPVARPAAPRAPSKRACFAGSETVRLGPSPSEVRSISDIRVGDQVLAADAVGRTFYSEVVFIPHGTNNRNSIFLQISTVNDRSIKMTSSHVIPSGPCGSAEFLPLVYASNVRVGDCIMTVSGEETVSAVEAVQGEGLYTIVTKAEYVVVNGIIASPFAFNHMAANAFYNVHRFLHWSVPDVLKAPWVRSWNEVSAVSRLSVRSHHFITLFLLLFKLLDSLAHLFKLTATCLCLILQAIGGLIPILGYSN